jgi:hypothetical protein
MAHDLSRRGNRGPFAGSPEERNHGIEGGRDHLKNTIIVAPGILRHARTTSPTN